MNSVEVFEGDRATHYDNFVETWIPCYHKFVSLLPDLLRSHQIGHNEVLIAGCGTGNEIKVLAEASSDWQLTGIDPSPDMVAQARQKLADYPNVSIVEGVVADLQSASVEVDAKLYDAATLLLVLHFFEDNGDKLALLRDIATRLKPQAPLIVFDINGDQNHIKQNLSVLKKLLPSDMDKDVIAFRLDRLENKLHHVSGQRFTELCREAGFDTPIRFFQSTIYMGWLLTKK